MYVEGNTKPDTRYCNISSVVNIYFSMCLYVSNSVGALMVPWLLILFHESS